MTGRGMVEQTGATMTGTGRSSPIGGLRLPPGRRRPRGLVWFLFWFLCLPSVVESALAVGGARCWIALTATVIALCAFTVGCWYSVGWLRETGEVPAGQIWPWLSILLAGGAVVISTLGSGGLALLVYPVILIGLDFSWRVTAAIGLLLALVLYLSLRIWTHFPDLQGWAFAVLSGGAGAAFGRIGAQRLHQRELLQRREHELEIADTRNQIARDLHDLLGHSLTAISVKAELAERLIDVDPLRARAELSDVRSLTRSALAEVRATVNDYRDVSLAAEIGRAHQMLDAAQIRHELPGAIDQVPEDLRTLFAWALREGVTNVVRHSGARHCRVELSATSITVTDDGDGVASSSGDSSGGNGIAGLRQRAAEAAAVVRTGPAPEGTPARPGFRLVVGRPEAMESAPGRPHSKDRARETA
ncbi:histidine kinase [Acidipropionibacterium jensenii]|uniref:histidine kinase n=1 Tax=Acidipropionibacterium jensenii TaxID=1749 RepID=UPI002647D36F|nr:histidine kinase [Acidipropionibacterium jensenii]MDN6591658.1 histidine kinase [Acidipropionibacterium jensenii]